MKLKATKNFNKGNMWEESTMKLKAQWKGKTKHQGTDSTMKFKATNRWEGGFWRVGEGLFFFLKLSKL